MQRQEGSKFRISLVQNEFSASMNSLVRPCVKIKNKRAEDIAQSVIKPLPMEHRPWISAQCWGLGGGYGHYSNVKHLVLDLKNTSSYD